MAVISYGGALYPLEDGESVLNGLLRQGVTLDHSCKAGVCGSCMMRAVGGTIPSKAQASLKDSWRTRGYFLSCICIPEGDVEVASPGAGFRFSAVIASVRKLSNDVVEASLTAEASMQFFA